MRFLVPILLFAMSVSLLADPAAPTALSVKAGPEFDIGFDVGAWNKAKFVFKNSGQKDWTVEEMEAQWIGSENSEPWTQEVNVTVAPGKEAKWLHDTYLPKDMFEKMPDGKVVMKGKFRVKREGKATYLPFELKTKRAVLEEPLASITGKYIYVSFQKSRFDGGLWQRDMLKWMDEVYECYVDLVGRKPFDGKITGMKESPNRFAWAYAGNPVTLTGLYVPDTISEFKQGLMSWGWAHEVGHNFDCDLTDYLRWDHDSTEFQANIKVLYAFDHMPSRKYLSIRWRGTDLLPRDKDERIPITKLGDRFFLLFGEGYLADKTRSWKTLDSDELQSFYQRIVRVYGWDPIKKWYRLIGAVKDKGIPAPTTPEEKVNFQFAALNKAVGQNLIKYYQLWRFPVTEESLKAAAEKYGLE